MDTAVTHAKEAIEKGTDVVELRLLLAGARPESILCLTYTKTAAAEMQNRLLKDLASWATMPPEALHEALSNLMGREPDDKVMAGARRLFGLRSGAGARSAVLLVRRCFLPRVGCIGGGAVPRTSASARARRSATFPVVRRPFSRR